MFDSGGDVADGETLVSAGGAFTMGFFSLGVPARRYLGIWFSVSEYAVCWVANRDSPLTGTSGVLVLGNAGRLLLTDGGQDRRRFRGGAAAGVRQPGRARSGQRCPPVAVVRPPVEHLAARHEDRQEPVDGGRVVHHVVALGHRPVSRPLPARHGDEGAAGERALAQRRQEVPHRAVERRPGDGVVRRHVLVPGDGKPRRGHLRLPRQGRAAILARGGDR
uniref:non-specific serine/threonine protein kinase n=1 Tax=Triticum urartu TaxID=4572 RepID=A0A8R7PJM8_TRIUA